MTTHLKHLIALATLSLWAAGPAAANDAQRPPAAVAGAATADMADGEVRKIDLDAGRITLRHGEIKNLDMPPMTMVFVVKDKALLDRVKTGDRVKFRAVQDAGKYTVIDLQPAP